MSEIQTDSSQICSSTIKLIGVGKAGCKVVAQMAQTKFVGVDFILVSAEFPRRIPVEEVTYLPINDIYCNEIKSKFIGTDMAIIVVGMGGRIGTRYAAEIAEIAKGTGALTIAIITKPFNFEGVIRSQVADRGILRLLKKVDSLFILPNSQITSSITCEGDLNGAFELSDVNIQNTVSAIVSIINAPAIIDVGIEGMKSVMKDAGLAWISTGMGKRNNRYIKAVDDALAGLMFNVPLYYDDTNNILFKIRGGPEMTLYAVNETLDILKHAFRPDTNIIFGVEQDSDMKDKADIIVIGTNRVKRLEKPEPSASQEELKQLIKDHRENIGECRWCFAIDHKRIKAKEIAKQDFPDATVLHLKCDRCGGEFSDYFNIWGEDYIRERMAALHPEFVGQISDDEITAINSLLWPKINGD